MKNLFRIELGYDESSNEWVSTIISVQDLKIRAIGSNKLSDLFNRIRKVISKKELEMRQFPVPEPIRILSLSKPAPRIIIPSTNGH